MKVMGMFSIRVFNLFQCSSSVEGVCNLYCNISCYLKDIFFPYYVSRKWVLPSRRPNGTQIYKNRALRTAFVKVSSNNN